MKAKLELALALFFISALAFVGTGCKKTTGGGWFVDESSGNKISFGFSAQPTGEDTAKGQFQLIDHGSKVKIHGIFDTTYPDCDTDTSNTQTFFEGSCSINGQGNVPLKKDVPLSVLFCDNGEPGVESGDYVQVFADDYHYSGTLQGGNIQIHKK